MERRISEIDIGEGGAAYDANMTDARGRTNGAAAGNGERMSVRGSQMESAG